MRVGGDRPVAAGRAATDELARGLGVHGPSAVGVAEEVRVGVAGTAAEAQVKDERGAVGREGGIRDRRAGRATAVVDHGAEQVCASDGRRRMGCDGRLAAAVMERREMVVKGEVDETVG